MRRATRHAHSRVHSCEQLQLRRVPGSRIGIHIEGIAIQSRQQRRNWNWERAVWRLQSGGVCSFTTDIRAPPHAVELNHCLPQSPWHSPKVPAREQEMV